MTRRQRGVSRIHERSLVEDGIEALEKETMYPLSAADVTHLQAAFMKAGSARLVRFLSDPENLRLIERELMTKVELMSQHIDPSHPTAHIKRDRKQSKREANGRV